MNLSNQLTLYAVTDRSWLSENTLDALVADMRRALQGGATFVQMREKGVPLTDTERLEEALALKALCAEYGVPFVIDDDVDLALASGADGVHVGQSDMAAKDARAALGADAIVGVSTRTVEAATKAEADGASYLGVGALFATGTKQDAVELPHDTVRAITSAVSIPCVGIGGVSASNVSTLTGLGLSGVAVVSGIFAAEDIAAATADLKAKVQAW